jgi:hypothetical protein
LIASFLATKEAKTRSALKGEGLLPTRFEKIIVPVE